MSRANPFTSHELFRPREENQRLPTVCLDTILGREGGRGQAVPQAAVRNAAVAAWLYTHTNAYLLVLHASLSPRWREPAPPPPLVASGLFTLLVRGALHVCVFSVNGQWPLTYCDKMPFFTHTNEFFSFWQAQIQIGQRMACQASWDNHTNLPFGASVHCAGRPQIKTPLIN